MYFPPEQTKFVPSYQAHIVTSHDKASDIMQKTKINIESNIFQVMLFGNQGIMCGK